MYCKYCLNCIGVLALYFIYTVVVIFNFPTDKSTPTPNYTIASNISIYFIKYFILIFILQSFSNSISFKFKIKLVTTFNINFLKIFYKGVDFNIRFMLQYGYEAIKRLVAELGKFFYVTYFITLN